MLRGRWEGDSGGAAGGKREQVRLVGTVGPEKCIQGDQRAAVVALKLCVVQIVELVPHIGIKAVVACDMGGGGGC